MKSGRVKSWKPFALGVVIWGSILGMGTLLMEVVIRAKSGFVAWSPMLKRQSFQPLERIKVYSSAVLKQTPQLGADWPIAVNTFESNEVHPPYFYKPNQKLKNYQLLPADFVGDYDFSTNALGLRGPLASIEKKPGTVRVVCVGGSVTEGQEKDSDTYPVWLERLLRHQVGSKVEVINAGLAGQSMEDHLALVRGKLLSLSPDWIVFLDHVNNFDISDFVEQEKFYHERESISLFSRIAWAFYNRSLLLQLLDENLEFAPPQVMASVPEALEKPSLTKHQKHLNELIAILRKEKVNLSLVGPSTIALDHDSVLKNYPSGARILRKTKMSESTYFLAVKQFNQAIAKVARDQGVPHLSLLDALPRNPDLYRFDLIHPSPRGNKEIARRIGRFLVPQMKSESRVLASEKDRAK